MSKVKLNRRVRPGLLLSLLRFVMSAYTCRSEDEAWKHGIRVEDICVIVCLRRA